MGELGVSLSRGSLTEQIEEKEKEDQIYKVQDGKRGAEIGSEKPREE